ncbi:MAG: transposase [Candidatus Neptunochlamydia sp.]|nr:transposase [Candidatus Neptunochlamydia sp.]
MVFTTKYQKTCFPKEHLTFMNKVFESVCIDFESKLMEFDAEKDHVYLLIHYLRKSFDDPCGKFLGNAFLSPSYFYLQEEVKTEILVRRIGDFSSLLEAM